MKSKTIPWLIMVCARIMHSNIRYIAKHIDLIECTREVHPIQIYEEIFMETGELFNMKCKVFTY